MGEYNILTKYSVNLVSKLSEYLKNIIYCQSITIVLNHSTVRDSPLINKDINVQLAPLMIKMFFKNDIFLRC